MSASQIGFEPDGDYVGKSGGKVGFFGVAPVVQRTLNANAAPTQPAASGSTFVASIQSIAVYAATEVDLIKTALRQLGLGV
jgi:hypothetical protein